MEEEFTDAENASGGQPAGAPRGREVSVPTSHDLHLRGLAPHSRHRAGLCSHVGPVRLGQPQPTKLLLPRPLLPLQIVSFTFAVSSTSLWNKEVFVHFRALPPSPGTDT